MYNLSNDAMFLEQFFALSEDLIHTHDLDSLLDRILHEARKISRADAGSIFLMRGDKLRFSYVHNDTMFTDQSSNKYLYMNYELEVDQESLAGYVALSGKSLTIDDAYDIPPDQPYRFNPSFDASSGYRTRSMLVAPLMTSRGKVVGVLQIINATSEQGEVVPFSERDRLYVSFLANQAAIAIERAIMNRELLLRTIKMAQFRDPRETGMHVNRVGAYSAEIYQRWANRRGLDEEEVKHNKDLIRVAAMLHDVGKVAISDTILKKPGRLTREEFEEVKLHTVRGAQLYSDPSSELEVACREIALNHHERWDGLGYPGQLDDVDAELPRLGRGKAGEEIPIAARIVALADVYDALVSARVYKDAWPEDRVMDTITGEAGTRFDPEVVSAFLEIYEVISAIRARYPYDGDEQSRGFSREALASLDKWGEP